MRARVRSLRRPSLAFGPGVAWRYMALEREVTTDLGLEDRPYFPTGTPVNWGYGSVNGETRVSSFGPWIEGIMCYPNCDGSTTTPALNVNDFICFQGRFAAGDPWANCDGSTTPPVLNVNDFICFQGRFAAGCP